LLNEFYKKLKHKKNDWFILSISLYLIIFIGWMIIGYPAWFAKLTFLSIVPENRAQIGVGVAGIILMIYSVYNYKYLIITNKIVFLLTFFTFIAIFLTGFYLRENYPTYISNIYKITAISLFSTLIFWAAITQKKYLFSISFLIFSIITSGTVHPIRLGVDPITNTAFIQQVKEIYKSDQKRWAVYNNGILSPLLYANGIKTATGVYLYPQSKWWSEFDKKNEYENIWNRFAHVYFTEPEHDYEKDKTEFRLLGLDSFSVMIDPCNKTLKNLDVNYFASNVKMRSECIQQIPSKWHGIYLYQRK
jgi:hypothetical protein